MTAQLLLPRSTVAIVLGAHDWTDAGLGHAPSFRRSARRIVQYLYDRSGLGLDPDLIFDLFDSSASASDQLSQIQDNLDAHLKERRQEGRPVTDILVYYIGHGHPDEFGGLSFLVRKSRKSLEAATGIRAADLAYTLRRAAPQQRRVLIIDCCFSEGAVKDFIGMSSSLETQVTSITSHELEINHIARGTVILCSSPAGRVSYGPPNADYTLFTGALIDILENGSGPAEFLSFSDLREIVFSKMLQRFGSKAPRPVLYQVDQTEGDLTRTFAFRNGINKEAFHEKRDSDPDKQQLHENQMPRPNDKAPRGQAARDPEDQQPGDKQPPTQEHKKQEARKNRDRAAMRAAILRACSEVSSQIPTETAIPVDKLNTARASLKVPEWDTVVALLDTTVFGSNTNGIALAIEAIYYKNMNENITGLILWSELENINFETQHSWRALSIANRTIKIAGSPISAKNLGILIRKIVTYYSHR